jgi:hypothetical protein
MIEGRSDAACRNGWIEGDIRRRKAAFLRRGFRPSQPTPQGVRASRREAYVHHAARRTCIMPQGNLFEYIPITPENVEPLAERTSNRDTAAMQLAVNFLTNCPEMLPDTERCSLPTPKVLVDYTERCVDTMPQGG